MDAQGPAVLAAVSEGIANRRIDNFNDIRKTPVKKRGVEFIGNKLNAGVSKPAGRVKSIGAPLEAARRSSGVREDPGFFERGQEGVRRGRMEKFGGRRSDRSLREISIGRIVQGVGGGGDFFIGTFVQITRKMRSKPAGPTGRILTKVGFDEVKARHRAASAGLVGDERLP